MEISEMETKAQYFDCLCRTCMNKVETSSHDGNTKPQQQWLSIFDTSEECGEVRIAELLCDAVPQIVVQPSDELPKKICIECLQRLLSVYRFQQICVQSDKEMHELLSEEQTVLKTPMLEEAKKGETETNDADSQPLKDLHCSSTLQYLQQPSIQEPLSEVTVQTIEQEAAQSSVSEPLQDNTLLLEQYNASKGEFEEFIKNEPMEDDEANSENSDGDTIHSIISMMKDEVLPIEFEDQQVHDALVYKSAFVNSTKEISEMETNTEYIDCLCRTCMNKVEASSHDGNTISQHQWLSIFDTIGECGEVRIAELLSDAVPQIEVQPSDELPKKICTECLQRLLSVYQFQQMCVQSDKQMHELLSKEQTVLKTPMWREAIKGETETNDADSQPLKDLRCSRTLQNLQQPAMQEPLAEVTVQTLGSEATQPSTTDHLLDDNQLLQHCNDSQGQFEEFIKNEPIENDEANSEYSDGDIMLSRISVTKDEVLPIEFEDQQVNDASILAEQRTNHAKYKSYECPYCPLRFSSKSTVSKHIKIHEGIKPHKCSICGKKFREKSNLSQHKRIHSNEKPHKCDVCEKRFGRTQELKAHKRSHTGEKPFKCKYCQSGFASHGLLRYHLRIHLGKNIHRCKFCPLAFPSTAEMRLHLTSHKNEDPEVRERNLKVLQEEEAKLVLTCSKDNIQRESKEEQQQQKLYNKEIDQPSSDSILAEQRSNHAKDKSYECPYCPLRFSSRSGVSKHKTIHEGIKPHKCSICGKTFREKGNLSQHKRIHSNEKPHKCDVCEKRFARSQQLKAHKPRHTGEKLFKCKYCQNGFATPNALSYHLRSHFGENIHRCKFCPLGFPSSAELSFHLTSHKNEDPEVRERNLKVLQEEEAKLHNKEIDQPSSDSILAEQRSSHAEEKYYECPYCPLRFTSKISESRHKTTIHEGIKEHECDICGKKFGVKSTLRTHKLSHSEGKPHKCDFCEKRFAQMQQLKVHIRTHTGEKPLKCKYCERGFAAFSILSKHLRGHLGKNIHRCNFCPLAFPLAAEMRLHLTSHKNEDPETRERNLKALEEEEVKLKLKFSKDKSKGQSTEEQQEKNLCKNETEQQATV